LLDMRVACLLGISGGGMARNGESIRRAGTAGEPPRFEGCLLPLVQNIEVFLRKGGEPTDLLC
jgi:hypothetical protein